MRSSEDNLEETSQCPGCGVALPVIDGPTHRYMESSPACWGLYGELLAREYGDYRYAANHRLTVNAYAVQHPGCPSRQAIQSVALHLLSLCAIFEAGARPREASALLTLASRRKIRLQWLEPPGIAGEFTVLDVWQAEGPQAHLESVEEWARSAWQAWTGHHRTVREWLREISGGWISLSKPGQTAP